MDPASLKHTFAATASHLLPPCMQHVLWLWLALPASKLQSSCILCGCRAPCSRVVLPWCPACPCPCPPPCGQTPQGLHTRSNKQQHRHCVAITRVFAALVQVTPPDVYAACVPAEPACSHNCDHTAHCVQVAAAYHIVPPDPPASVSAVDTADDSGPAELAAPLLARPVDWLAAWWAEAIADGATSRDVALSSVKALRY
jgi:hypothetical protein